MPLYIADFLSATAHLDSAQSGAYLLLIMHYWQKGALPQSDKFLARIARMPDRQWAANRDAIKSFFRDDWTHHRVESEMAHAQKKAEARAVSGSRGGISKALKHNTRPVANATVSPQQTPSKIGSKPLPSSSGLELEDTGVSSNDTHEKPVTENAKAQKKFPLFWQPWPNKVGKAAAEKAWPSALKDALGDETVIVAGIERYVLWKPPEREWLNPATFLNQRRWKDEYLPRLASPSRNASNGNERSGIHAAFRLVTENPPERDAPRLPTFDSGEGGSNVVGMLSQGRLR